MSPGSYPSMAPSPGFYGNFFHHNNSMAPPPPQLPPLSSLDFPWHQLPPHQQAGPSHYDPHQASSSSSMPGLPYIPDTHYGSLSNLGESSRGNSRRSVQPPPAQLPSTAASSPEVEQTEAERNASAEEKRRRNTAASARFRIKKKQRTTNLERTVSDLTSRADELEREVSDLRRENGWLKEIVMLKGTRFAAANLSNRMAIQNQAASATISGPQALEPSGQSGSVGGSQPSDSASDGSSSDEEGKEEARLQAAKRAKKAKGKK
ncbi:hypothetical protein BDQ12DRAFT_679220 [Crucibulum laeve]|uniref:BZIP domain-containing protein n=1 Tax=Crucibulum laeve TaxID=68775 RepID=A0A5C3MA04_9AGAR|nr:hypothetical protein BDQ12DRAFT_679220 [Crucibulum laeve]